MGSTVHSTMQINFSGFSPSSATQSYFEQVLEEVKNESPSRAIIKGTFKKVGQVYKGFIQINSKAGRFFVKDEGTNLYILGNHLLHTLRRQLDKVKRKRHDKIINHLPLEESEPV